MRLDYDEPDPPTLGEIIAGPLLDSFSWAEFEPGGTRWPVVRIGQREPIKRELRRLIWHRDPHLPPLPRPAGRALHTPRTPRQPRRPPRLPPRQRSRSPAVSPGHRSHPDRPPTATLGPITGPPSATGARPTADPTGPDIGRVDHPGRGERPMTTMDTIPAPIAKLDRDKHGRVIPWFVHRAEDRTPDFRVIRRDGIRDALRYAHCWVCGQTRGRHAAFVVGPMCGINRVSAEPPSHLDCAIYAARTCPFLVRPEMARRPRGLPDLNVSTPGIAIERNPGVALVWSSRSWKPFQAWDGSGTLINLGDPTAVRWYAHGRDATRGEVLASIESGLPILRDSCQRDDDPAHIDRQITAFMPLVPGE